MIHLIYTSLPLDKIPGDDANKLKVAVDRWGQNHSRYEHDPNPNFQIRKVKDSQGKERIEWRRIFNRVLHIPSVLEECSLNCHGFNAWSKYVELIAVATDVQFRTGRVTRFSVLSQKNKSSISEVQDENGLNRLQLRIEQFQEFSYVFGGFVQDIEWFQGYVVFFLETAAVYHLAHQAILLSSSDTRNPAVVAMRKKLDRIQRICNLEDCWTRGKEHE